MKEEILAAVMFLIKFIEKSDSFPHDQIENFKHHLTTLLLERFEKHWFPERPARGQGYRCIRVNGVSPVDGTLERAASRCGLRYRDLRLPQELTVWVDPAEVCYRLGESEGSYCTLATFPLLGSKGGKTPTINTNTLSLSNTNNSSSSYSSSSSSTPSSSASSEASSDCASLSSRSPSPLATTISTVAQLHQQQQQQQQVYQGPMRRSPFTVNGGGGRFVRGVGTMQPQQQQQQMQGSCRTALNMQQQQQQRFMMGGFNGANATNAANAGSANRLKPRELGYNVQQQQTATSNNQQQQRTTPSGTWRCDGPPNAFAPPMFNPLQHFTPPHSQFNSHQQQQQQQQQPFNRSSSNSSSNSAVMAAVMGPNGVPAYNQQRIYKNVVRV